MPLPGTLDTLFTLLEKHGNSPCPGESITFLQHCLQCSMLAEQSNFDQNVVLAALFHDIGHVIGFETGAPQLVAPDGTVLGCSHHEVLGADYLERIGFPTTVSDMVRYHVNAKRFKVTVNKAYQSKLTPAGWEMLKLQGGTMSEEEAFEFSNHPYMSAFLALTVIDDSAKDPTAVTHPLSYYRKMTEDYLAALV